MQSIKKCLNVKSLLLASNYLFLLLINCCIVIYFSLHKSLSHEQGLRDQFNATMDNFEEKLRAKEGEIQLAHQSYDEVVAKMNALVREKSVIASQLKETLQQVKEERTRADK